MFDALNKTYYDLFGDLYVNRELLPDRQYKVMAAALMDGYQRQLKALVGRNILETAQEVFDLNFRLKHHVPHGFWIFRNPVARMYRKACKAALAEFVAGLASQMEARAVAELAPPEVLPEVPTEAPAPDEIPASDIEETAQQ